MIHPDVHLEDLDTRDWEFLRPHLFPLQGGRRLFIIHDDGLPLSVFDTTLGNLHEARRSLVRKDVLGLHAGPISDVHEFGLGLLRLTRDEGDDIEDQGIPLARTILVDVSRTSLLSTELQERPWSMDWDEVILHRIGRFGASSAVVMSPALDDLWYRLTEPMDEDTEDGRPHIHPDGTRTLLIQDEEGGILASLVVELKGGSVVRISTLLRLYDAGLSRDGSDDRDADVLREEVKEGLASLGYTSPVEIAIEAKGDIGVILEGFIRSI